MRRATALLTALVLIISIPAVVFAATATPAPSAVATAALARATVGAPIDELQAQLWPEEPSGCIIVVSAAVSPDAALPAIVRMPLPEGATIIWSGEVGKGDTSSDIQRPFTLEQGVGGRVAVIRIEKYREAQYEATYKDPTPIGDKLAATLDWVQSAPAATTAFAAKLTAGATDIALDPTAMGPAQKSPQGESLYSLVPNKLKVGESFTMTVAYRRGTAAAGTGVTSTPGAPMSSQAQTLLIVLVALIIAALVAMVVIAARSRGRSPRPQVAPDSDRSRTTGTPASADDDPFDIDLE
ncbi:MAG: hypothetical protein Q7W30_10355 [Coriobacteriia bacterium]|nr:hypothetical protein [Coriobacteriia bacterium]